jgi:nucleoporin-like protein 2
MKTLLISEADAIIHGKQFLFSCFGPFKESSCLPNFIQDLSFEELRLGFLEATKNNSTQAYLSNLINEYNSAFKKINELKSPTSDMILMLASIYNNSTEQKGPSMSTPSKTMAPTQNPFQSNIFGTPQIQQQQQQQSTVAMSTNSIFGNTVSSNPFQQQSTQPSFFGSAASAPQQNTFSFAQSQNPLGNEITKPSIFAQSSIFSSAPQQNSTQQASTNTSIFGSSTFGQTNQPSIYGGAFPSSMQQQQPVQQPVQQSVFSFNQPTIGQPNPMMQTNQTNQNSIFQPQIQNPPLQASGNSIFGGNSTLMNALQQPHPQQSLGNPFQPPQVIKDDHFYSKIEELTADEIQAFQADMFSGKVPLNPPAKNLCF